MKLSQWHETISGTPTKIMSVNEFKSFLPELFSIVQRSDQSIQEILDKFNLRSSKHNELHCILDWIVMASEGDGRCISFLKFIDSQFHSSFELLESKFYGWLRLKLWSIVSAMDTDSTINNNPTYLNHLGEVFTLVHVLKNGEKKFKLEGIEVKLPNGKQADFSLENIDGNILYLDTFSIHSIEPSKIDQDSDLIAFLEFRFNQKLLQKTDGLIESQNLIVLADKRQVPMTILPIIWTEIENLVPFKKAFLELEGKNINVLSCCSLHPEQLPTGEIVFAFCRVLDTIEGWERTTKKE